MDGPVGTPLLKEYNPPWSGLCGKRGRVHVRLDKRPRLQGKACSKGCGSRKKTKEKDKEVVKVRLAAGAFHWSVFARSPETTLAAWLGESTSSTKLESAKPKTEA